MKDALMIIVLSFTRKEIGGCFPAALIESGDNVKWCHPGASVGSFVVPEDLAFADALEMVEQLEIIQKGKTLTVLN
jgi:hypothetical protein